MIKHQTIYALLTYIKNGKHKYKYKNRSLQYINKRAKIRTTALTSAYHRGLKYRPKTKARTEAPIQRRLLLRPPTHGVGDHVLFKLSKFRVPQNLLFELRGVHEVIELARNCDKHTALHRPESAGSGSDVTWHDVDHSGGYGVSSERSLYCHFMINSVTW